MSRDTLLQERRTRAQSIRKAGGIEQAIESGLLCRRSTMTVSEALVLGLLRQGVTRFVGVFGHGTTEIGEVLRVYEEAGLVRTFAVRHEGEATHAASALRWVTGEKACVFTSIGPGALHALAASLVPASDGLGVWFLLGDETTEDEGPNMQQIPRNEQELFLRLFSVMGGAYCLHTPGALPTALRRGLNTVDHPHRGGPFFLLLPMNVQPMQIVDMNLDELPVGAPPPLGSAADNGTYARAADQILSSERIVVKVGGGARGAGAELLTFLDLADAVAVVSPLVTGILPFGHERNMCVGGSKGSISGNFAMEEADLLVALGARAVCQSDSSRTGYPKAKGVININCDFEAATHYGKTTALVGDIASTLARLNEELRSRGAGKRAQPSRWLLECRAKRREWDAFRQARYDQPCLYDPAWGAEVLTQPAAIKVATDWARRNDAVTFFDAGDVQANGFQVVEDDRLGRTFNETGASYMGFAVSALLATAITAKPFYGLALSGDGSFTMSPQVLIDGVQHGAQGSILVLDNRRMGAISGLQDAQYGAVYATNDSVEVDYVAWGRALKGLLALDGGRSVAALTEALDRAKAHQGLSLIHVPVYWGPDPLGGLGAFGRWNVGNWCEETQALRHRIGL